MTEQTYVHGEWEVKKTGRNATKAMPGGKTMVMCEITPVNENDGDWKKWVNPQALFTIVETKEK
jgi:hypothetical protein